MRCPACGRPLTEKTVSEIVVDVCEGGCGGVWFDQFELQKLDDGDETGGEELLDIARDPSVQVDLTAKRNCPRCENIVMMQHFYGAKHRVTVDSCAGCAGYWLDGGELAAIRQQYDTESAREQDMDDDFDASIGEKMDSLSAEETRAMQARAREVRRMTRFLRPSRFFRRG